MKCCQKCRQTLSLDMFSGLKSAKDGLQARCKPCANAYAKQRAALLKETAHTRVAPASKTCTKCKATKLAEYFAANSSSADRLFSHCKACVATYQAKWRVVNYSEIALKKLAYNESNKDKLTQFFANYYEENKPAYMAHSANRRAKKLRATPAWSELDAIRQIYLEADFMTKITGQKHHVDHIVPLQSPLVCGLHVAANLRIITATENLKKGNLWWPNMPEKV